MPVIKIKFFTRELLQANPTWLFVFGDNLLRRGLGGQAKACRGEPNAVGIPTKRAPSMDEASFFTDADYYEALGPIANALMAIHHHLAKGGVVALPADGVGTGLAQLPERAPRIYAYIENTLDTMTTKASATYGALRIPKVGDIVRSTMPFGVMDENDEEVLLPVGTLFEVEDMNFYPRAEQDLQFVLVPLDPALRALAQTVNCIDQANADRNGGVYPIELLVASPFALPAVAA